MTDQDTDDDNSTIYVLGAALGFTLTHLVFTRPVRHVLLYVIPVSPTWKQTRGD